MEYNSAKLRGRIIEKYGTYEAFAIALDMSRPTLSLRLNGLAEWKQSEMKWAIKLLEIEPSAVSDYFFSE